MATRNRDDMVEQATRLLMGAVGLGEALIDREELSSRVFELLRWTPEARPDCFPDDEEGRRDSEAPFLSEAYLCRLLGKADAHTLLGQWNRLMQALGLSRWDEWETQEDCYPPGRLLSPETIADMTSEMRERFARKRRLIEEDDEGGWRVTAKGEEHNRRVATPFREARKLRAFEITSGPNANTVIYLGDRGEWFGESWREIFRRHGWEYTSLYSADSGDPDKPLKGREG